MADKIIQFYDDSGDLVPVKAVDNGDGTYSMLVTSPNVTVDNDLTGIITVTISGTPVSGGNVPASNGFYLKGHPDNTDTVWFMPDGRTKADGYPLNASEQIPVSVANLNLLDFDSDVNAGKICWEKA